MIVPEKSIAIGKKPFPKMDYGRRNAAAPAGYFYLFGSSGFRLVPGIHAVATA